jgi:hypothetical protein
VDCCDNVAGNGYSDGVVPSDNMESRGGTTVGEKAAFNFDEAVARFRVNVIGAVGVGFYLIRFIRRGGMEEVANALLTLTLDGTVAHTVGRIKVKLGEWKGTVYSAAASEALNEFAGFSSEPRDVR